MTDFSKAATPPFHLPKESARGLPNCGLSAWLPALSAILGDAHRMAFVDPFVGRRRLLNANITDDAQGRDPTW